MSEGDGENLSVEEGEHFKGEIDKGERMEDVRNIQGDEIEFQERRSG